MIDGVLDLVLMIFVLGIVISTMFGLVTPLVRQTNELKYDEIYDKTAAELNGLNANEYKGDGCMSYDELILTIMRQTYFMPKPRMIDVCGKILGIKEENVSADGSTTIKADQVFEPNSVDIGAWVVSTLDEWHKSSPISGVDFRDLRFTILYDLGDTEEEIDDMYALFVLWNGKLYKCLKDGQMAVRKA